MNNFKKLKERLINTWTNVYHKETHYQNILLNILEELESIDNIEFKKQKAYPFVGIALKEIDSLNKARSPYGELVESIVELESKVPWYPNPTFKDDKTAIKNLNYCANLVGYTNTFQKKPYLFYNKNIIIGLFLMGKNQFYPEHNHSAHETWVVLSGNAKWKLEDGNWKIKEPGSHFTYTKNQVHAMKTEDEILLALWAWTGEIDNWAEWTK